MRELLANGWLASALSAKVLNFRHRDRAENLAIVLVLHTTIQHQPRRLGALPTERFNDFMPRLAAPPIRARNLGHVCGFRSGMRFGLS